MGLVYEDTPVPFDPRRAPKNPDAVKCWLTHYGNALYLKFIAQNPKATSSEKVQAGKEIVIAEQKMKYWERHETYDKAEAIAGAENLKKMWEDKR